MERLPQDLRYAARVLAKSPGFTIVAVVSLALGIGANTSIFSIADAVLLKTVPVSHPEDLRLFAWVRQGSNAGMKNHSGYGMVDDFGRHIDGSFSYPAFNTFRTLPQFSDVVAYAQNQFAVTAAGTTDVVFGHYVSGNYFTGLGAQPLIGRPLLADDDRPSSPRAIVLTHAYWMRRFGGDPTVVGRTIQLNREPATVVGVMQPAFQGLQPGRAVDVFVPMSMVPSTATFYTLDANDNWWVQIFGRVKPGVSDAAATAAVQAALENHIASYAGSAALTASRVQVVMEPGSRGVTLLRGSLHTTLYILTAAAGLVLLIACLNLANLLLARYSARAKEIAVRVSIGASRGRLVRQMLAESLLLAGAGAVAGLSLARASIPVLLGFLSATMPLGIDARLDLRAVAFAFAAAMLTALLFGAIPAWRATRVDAGPVLKESAAGMRFKGPRITLGRYLVSVQIAFSLLLLVGTGLFVRTLFNLAAVDLGFQTDRILTFQTDPGRSGYKPADELRVYRRIEERLAAIPGVQSVGMSQQALIGGVVTNGGVRFPGDAKEKQTWFLDCSDSFLATMGIPVVLGRDLSRADFDLAARSAVVNESFVKQYLAGRNPIGQVFDGPDWSRGGQRDQFTIVGVAKDAHYATVRGEVPPTAYLPYASRPGMITGMAFAIRTRIDPALLAGAVRQAVAGVDSTLPIADLRTENAQIERSLSTERMFAMLVTAFGAIALVLAAVGLYGIMAYSVARRTSEIGIRMALGARRGNVQWLVLRQSLLLALLGVTAGVPAALELTTLISRLLFGVKPNDPASIAAAVFVLLAVAAFAAWIPARRAARVDPMVALRYE